MTSTDGANTPLLTPATASSPGTSGTSTPRPAAADPLGFMEKLSNSIYLLRQPTPSPTAKKTAAPKLLIMCSWMDARAAHIAKYIAAYRDGQVFSDGSVPETILLVRSNQSYVFDREKSSAILQLAVPVLQEAFAAMGEASKQPSTKGGPDVQVLVHTFSNGGCIMLSQLYDELAALGGDGTKGGGKPATQILPHVTIFDSCPGKFHYRSAAAAFSVPFERKPLAVRLVSVPIVHLFVLYYWLRWEAIALWTGQRELAQVPGKPNAQATAMYRAWVPPNDHTAESRNLLETSRAYIYSPGDTMILAEDVEEHAQEATAAGYNVVRLEKFPNSAHVAHQRADPERYWRTVREVWEQR